MTAYQALENYITDMRSIDIHILQLSPTTLPLMFPTS